MHTMFSRQYPTAVDICVLDFITNSLTVLKTFSKQQKKIVRRLVKIYIPKLKCWLCTNAAQKMVTKGMLKGVWMCAIKWIMFLKLTKSMIAFGI